MRIDEELESLERKAVQIARIPDRKLRHKGGYLLEHECRSLDDRYRIIGGLDPNAEVSLRAILTIIFDFILYDALEDEDWQMTMPDRADEDLVMKTIEEAKHAP